MEELPGLYFMRARYYSAEAGVFLSTDPVRSISPVSRCLPYLYCNLNPILRSDASGSLFQVVDSLRGTQFEQDFNQAVARIETFLDNAVNNARTDAERARALQARTAYETLRDSAEVVYVDEYTGNNSSYNNRTILWNPKGLSPYYAGREGYSISFSGDVVLGHEMKHAYDDVIAQEGAEFWQRDPTDPMLGPFEESSVEFENVLRLGKYGYDTEEWRQTYQEATVRLGLLIAASVQQQKHGVMHYWGSGDPYGQRVPRRDQPGVTTGEKLYDAIRKRGRMHGVMWYWGSGSFNPKSNR
jgi:RHS repeat-associated protein